MIINNMIIINNSVENTKVYNVTLILLLLLSLNYTV